jgi:prepilin-type N-terminal cleavage/methylation domain-containing protein
MESACMHRVGKQLAREVGFTLIELLVVIAIIGILVAIAVPAYLGFDRTANRKAAAADVRSAVPNASLYHAQHGSYSGMTVAALQSLDSGLAIDHVVVSADDASYCLDRTVDGQTAKVTRGEAMVAGGAVVENAGVC